MGNPGSGLTYVERHLLDHLADRQQMEPVRLLDRAPVRRDELNAGDADGIEAALWIADASARLKPPNAANANEGRIRYDEVITLDLRIQAAATVESAVTLDDVKARAELALNEVLRVCTNYPDVRALSGHAMLTLLMSGYQREAGRLVNGRGWIARYTVDLEARARITPTA